MKLEAQTIEKHFAFVPNGGNTDKKNVGYYFNKSPWQMAAAALLKCSSLR